MDEGILIKEQLIRKDTVMVGDWEYKTYQEVAIVIRYLAAALSIKVDGKLHMFGRNRLVICPLLLLSMELPLTVCHQLLVVYAFPGSIHELYPSGNRLHQDRPVYPA